MARPPPATSDLDPYAASGSSLDLSREDSSHPGAKYRQWQSPSGDLPGGQAEPGCGDTGRPPPPVGLYPQYGWQNHDPRSSSTQSLVPSVTDDNRRRTLLVVYIHGFMGNNSSFRSFPSHVHSYLKAALASSHVIHTKIYPRYKTYKAIDVARDNFSKWLEPHESERTDVILVGHSMGGLLAADVVLMPSPNPVYGYPFKHRILGTICLDAPLLGLHPGIVVSGLVSLFRKAPEPLGGQLQASQTLATTQSNASGSVSPDTWSTLSPEPSILSETSTASGTTTPPSFATNGSSPALSPGPDPWYNPPFFNDVQFIDRGWWRNMVHFAKKHKSEGLVTSAYNHLLSHLEFGGCLADYPGLNNRYNKLRHLEDVDDFAVRNTPGRSQEAQVRFVNYYTVSTGIPKKPTTPKRSDTHLKPEVSTPRRSFESDSATSTPRISIEDYSDGERPQMLELLEPIPEPAAEPQSEKEMLRESAKTSENRKENVKPETSRPLNDSINDSRTSQMEPETLGLNDWDSDLPAISPLPDPPVPPDLDRYTDKEERKQAEKEAKRAQKAYEQAVKNHNKALKERRKLVEKRRRKLTKATAKQVKEARQRQASEVHGDEKQISSSQEGNDLSRVDAQNSVEVLQKRLTDLSMQDAHTMTAKNTEAQRAARPAAQEKAKIKENSSGTGDREKKSKTQKKPRKFCMLPHKVNGARDHAWMQVYMEGVDEVGAHCGLFFPGQHYEQLVGDVGSRIVGWVQENASKQAIHAGEWEV